MTFGWLEAIASRTHLSPPEAELRLRRWGIGPDRPGRPARSLIIRMIAFGGEKRGLIEGPIDFAWSDLDSGVWAVTSGRNFAGKSTILEIVLWCLRGTPKALQDDVQSWLDRVSLDFDVDDQHYRVAFEVANRVPHGTLARLRPDGVVDVLDRFSSDGGFTAVMSRFMMDTLDLEPLPAMQGAEGLRRVVEHGWTALSGALYFGGDHKVLLGDVQMSGLPARMLQMYIGLPWASTLMQATTAKKQVDQEREQAIKAAAQRAAEAKSARERLELDLKSARAALAALPTAVATSTDLAARAADIARLAPQGAELQAKLAAAETEAEQVRRIATEDERSLRDLRENIVAAQFFNGLEPTCCPRCESRVTKARIKHESVAFACSLCSEQIPVGELERASEALLEAEQRTAASQAALSRSLEQTTILRKQVEANAGALELARASLDEAAKSTDYQKRRDAELRVARLEGALEERQDATAEAEENPDAALIRIAEDEARKAYESGRSDVLEALNTEILGLGQRMGVKTLESVQLNSNAVMQLTKGGVGTSFSKVTAGERLRLRLATAIALLRVGRDRGLGRHPGLLIIDSPGAEEVSDIDLFALLDELQSIAKETAGLQVIVGSANPASITRVLGVDHCRVALGDDYVW